MKFFLAICLSSLSYLPLSFAGTVTTPTNQDYGAFFSRVHLAGSYLLLQRMVDNASIESTYVKSKYGIEDLTELPEAQIDGHFIKFAGLKKKLDLSKLQQGEIYDGTRYFRFNTKEVREREFEKLVLFLQAEDGSTSSGYSLHNLLLPRAEAADIVPPKVKSAVSIALGLYGVGMAYQLAEGVAAATAGTTAVIGAGTAAALTAGALVWGLVAESAIKAGIRLWKGDQVVCENGQLKLRKKTGELAPIEGQTSNKFKEYFAQLEIGSAELAVRKMFCSRPTLLADVNKKLNAAMAPSPPSKEYFENPVDHTK